MGQLSQFLQQAETGQLPPFTLLKLAMMLFLYVLPSVLAFIRGQRKFFLMLPLNLVVILPQAILVHYLDPSLFVVNPQNAAAAIVMLAAILWGPGWIALLIWSLMPGESDPRLIRAQQTKYYDAVVALPLILWFAYGALQLRPVLAADANRIAAGTAGLFGWMQFISFSLAALFDLLLIYLLVVRHRPIAKSKGAWGRVFGFVGTFMGVGVLTLPQAHLTLWEQMLAALLVGLGSLGSLLVLWRLGKSFSIMPEARRLVTSGPYALARHPLYAVEMITVCGTAMQFQGPWSWAVAATVLVLLWIRSHYEEQVLEAAYPEYGAYRTRTKRFIPGVI